MLNDKSEQVVFDHLSSQGFKGIVYEPDGNIPPDFLVDGRFAIEVRRLNQHEETEAGYRGLEEVAIPLDARLARLCHSLGTAREGRSWYVFHEFERPLRPWRELQRAIRTQLEEFLQSPTMKRSRIQIDDRFHLELELAGKTYATALVPGGSSDYDSGGHVVAEMERNLRICVEEKSRKVKPYIAKYPEWWLALVDHISYGDLDDSELLEVQESVRNREPWNRILLINPLSPASALEI